MKTKQIARLPAHTKGPTLFEVFQNALIEYESENSPKTIQSESQSFTLYEDLKILLELSKVPQIEQHHFEKIGTMLKRNKISIKRRYSEYLKNIDQSDLEFICQFIQNEGIKGHLIFKVEQGGWKLENIGASDTFEKPPQKSVYKETPQKPIQIETPQKPITPFKSQQVQFQSQEINESKFESIQKKVKQENAFQLSANSKYDQSNKKALYLKNDKLNLTSIQKKEAEELKFNLKIFADWLKISYQEAVQRLYQCSGDLNQLYDVYVNKQEYLLWNKEADEALAAYEQERDQGQKLQLLAVLRHQNENKKRQLWLQS